MVAVLFCSFKYPSLHLIVIKHSQQLFFVGSWKRNLTGLLFDQPSVWWVCKLVLLTETYMTGELTRVLPRIWKQGVKIEDFFNLGGRKLVTQFTRMIIATLYWLSKTKCASLCHLMYLLSSRNISLDSNKYRKSCKIQLGVIFPKILCLGVEMTPWWLPG